MKDLSKIEQLFHCSDEPGFGMFSTWIPAVFVCTFLKKILRSGSYISSFLHNLLFVTPYTKFFTIRMKDIEYFKNPRQAVGMHVYSKFYQIQTTDANLLFFLSE